MAFGDKKVQYADDGFYPEVQVKGVEFGNIKSNIAKTRIRFSYWRNLLKISITPITEDDAGRWVDVIEERVSIFLSQTNAAMFMRELDAFEKHIGGNHSYGIKYAKTVAFITDDNPEQKICLVIRKFKDDMCTDFDKEIVYEFNTGKHFSVRDCDDKDISNAKNIPYPELEFNMMKLIITEYLKSFTAATVGAMAFYGRDTIYDRANNNLDAIASKLDVSLKNPPYIKGAPYNNKGKTFSNNSRFSTKKSSMDDIDSMIAQ